MTFAPKPRPFCRGGRLSPDANYAAAYQARRAAVGQKGYGMFARHHVFTIEDGRLVPVRYPDPQRLSELPGYEREREKVIANTRALLEGKPANNVLLYGDAGTGKSSAVKAIANAFAPDGLRLVEVKKNQLYQIPALMDALAAESAEVHPLHRRPELHRPTTTTSPPSRPSWRAASAAAATTWPCTPPATAAIWSRKA